MYEVYALKYGERDTTACQFFYRESSHDNLTLDYFVLPESFEKAKKQFVQTKPMIEAFERWFA